MPTPDELKEKFWNAVASDRTMMLALSGHDDAHARPMTGQLHEDREGAIWFFTAKDTDLARQTGSGAPAVASFADKGHDIFACVHGMLVHETDRSMVDKLWNPFVAAWYEEGKDDPKLALLRMDADRAEIWANGSSILAGIKLLLGSDPKKDYRDSVAEVRL